MAERRDEELLLQVYEARQDPLGIARALEMNLHELAAWAGRGRTVRALRGLCLVADMQTQLILSRYRATAAAKLLHLANQEENGELARKASVDLLKTELAFPDGEGAEADDADRPPKVNEQSVLKALAALGGDGGDGAAGAASAGRQSEGA